MRGCGEWARVLFDLQLSGENVPSVRRELVQRPPVVHTGWRTGNDVSAIPTGEPGSRSATDHPNMPINGEETMMRCLLVELRGYQVLDGKNHPGLSTESESGPGRADEG